MKTTNEQIFHRYVGDNLKSFGGNFNFKLVLGVDFSQLQKN